MATRRGAPRIAGQLWRQLQRGPIQQCAAATVQGSFSSGAHALRTYGRIGYLLRQQQQTRGYASQLPAHTELAMPSLSPTMTQGNISAWKKKEGDAIAPGDVLAEIETDKATMEWEAQEEGFLAKVLKPDGSKEVPVGTAVALIVEEQGDIAAFKDHSAGAGAASTPAAPAAAAAPSGSFPPHQVLSLPALSPTMTQGNISHWVKKVGEAVAPGDVLCEMETDKASISWESQDEGFLAHILVGDGTKDIPIGTPVAVLVEEQEQVAAFAGFTAADAGAAAAKPAAASAPPPPAPTAAPAAAPRPAAPAAAKPAVVGSGDRVIATPYAKKLAADAGVSLQGVAGSGPAGRIIASDVQNLLSSGKGLPAAAAAPGAISAAGFTDLPVSQIKKVTAARLLESKQTIPHYYLTMECQMDALLALRAQVNESLAASGTKLSVNDFIIKAAALALRKVPAINSSWMGDFIRQYNNVDVNVAVQTPVGLMVPFVRDADRKGLQAISADVKELAGKAKEGKLQPAEFMGGTFTISNLGMFGVKQFAAIVNPPQAAILAVGSTDKKVVLTKAGDYKEQQCMNVTLSCDHRVVDGAVGAEWLQAFKGYVENPLTMLL